jgi:hypothetical protein
MARAAEINARLNKNGEVVSSVGRNVWNPKTGRREWVAFEVN